MYFEFWIETCKIRISKSKTKEPKDKNPFIGFHFNFIKKEIMEKESRITAAIDSGFVLSNNSKWYNIYTQEGLNILGNIIEGNADSYNPNFYGSIDALGRKILGYNLEPSSKYQIFPSALETFSASMRDPAFYRLYKRIISYYDR